MGSVAIILGGTFLFIWRGAMMNEAPNIQPAITLGLGGFELGLWGSSTLAKTNAGEDQYALSHEVDLWAGYTFQFSSGLSIRLAVTDYTFPNAGIRLGNFNNHDAPQGPGAHTVETGITLAGPPSFPLSLSAYANVYNDAGNNTYFQLDYAATVKGVDLGLFLGAAGGSDKNPAYYGTDSFSVINLGFTATKTITVSDKFSLPVFVTYSLNPRTEMDYLVFGFSL